jgi:hypothetical protein
MNDHTALPPGMSICRMEAGVRIYLANAKHFQNRRRRNEKQLVHI